MVWITGVIGVANFMVARSGIRSERDCRSGLRDWSVVTRTRIAVMALSAVSPRTGSVLARLPAILHRTVLVVIRDGEPHLLVLLVPNRMDLGRKLQHCWEQPAEAKNA